MPDYLPRDFKLFIKGLFSKVLALCIVIMWFPLQAGQTQNFTFKFTFPEPRLGSRLPCLLDMVACVLRVVMWSDNGSFVLGLNFCLEIPCLLSGVKSITLSNTGLFAALALFATNSEISLMFGLLPACWIPYAIFDNLSMKVKR